MNFKISIFAIVMIFSGCTHLGLFKGTEVVAFENGTYTIHWTLNNNLYYFKYSTPNGYKGKGAILMVYDQDVYHEWKSYLVGKYNNPNIIGWDYNESVDEYACLVGLQSFPAGDFLFMLEGNDEIALLSPGLVEVYEEDGVKTIGAVIIEKWPLNP